MRTKTEDLLKKISLMLTESKDFSEEEMKLWIRYNSKVLASETVLSSGGYIQDKNKKECKAGDSVNVIVSGETLSGVLVWDRDEYCFEIEVDNLIYNANRVDWSKKNEQ